MTYVIIGATIWVVVGGISYWWSEIRQYQKYPHRWTTRHHGLISFSDKQRRWVYALWPFVVVATIGWGLAIAGVAAKRRLFG